MEKYEFTKNFEVKFNDSDFKDNLKISSALAYMEEGASLSADELGFGYEVIKPRGHAFIITNTHCEFIRPVMAGETITLKSWPLKPSFAIFQREYRFLDKKEEPVLIASSRWCLIDMKTGRILPSKTIDDQDYSTYNTERLFENVQWKIPAFDITDKKALFTITIANSEYDHNMHVNNTKYASYCLNVFSVEELKTKRLKTFSISYVKQCKEGETLRFYKNEEDGVYFVQGVNDLGEIVVQSRITFEG